MVACIKLMMVVQAGAQFRPVLMSTSLMFHIQRIRLHTCVLLMGGFFSFNGFGLLSSTIHTPDDFVKVQFVSDKKGFVVAMQGNVWMTADGGTTWDTIKTDQQLLKSAFFQNENTGYLVGPRGKMEYTINAGGMWLEATLNIHETVQFNDVYFLNTSFGVMAGNKGTIIRTLDRGTNWIDEPTKYYRAYQCAHFPKL
jgi:hypothetical protein